MINLTEFIKRANELSITVYLVPEEDNEAKVKQGIHLLMPSQWQLDDSLEVAERDGFTAIYIHTIF